MICITFDNFGCGSGKLPPCPFPDVVPASEWENYNEIGLTLGHPRILGLLRQLRIKATFFAEGYAAVIHPQEVQRWHDEGHEIALHGWKHETWSGLACEADEDRLVRLSVAAMHELLGESPVGFRPPGLQINRWTDDVMHRNGIKYIAHATQPMQTRLPLLPCSPQLIDAALIAPASGGLFGTLDADTAYNQFYDLALDHERTTPEQPWVLVIHPLVSGNRGWSGLEKFLRKLRAQFTPDVFKTGREVALV